MEVDAISGRIASGSANRCICGVKFRVTIESDEDGVFVAECSALFPKGKRATSDGEYS